MRATNLKQLISVTHSLNNSYPVAITDGIKKIYYSELIRTPSKLFCKRVMLYFEETTNLVKALFSLDGSAEVICPIPTSMNNNDLIHIFKKNNFDILITDINEKQLQNFKSNGLFCLCLDEFESHVLENPILSERTTSWLIPTSGTSAKPKLVKHDTNSLTFSALERYVKSKPVKKEIWGLFYDSTRYAGYQVILNSLINGSTLVAPSPNDEIRKKIMCCKASSVTHISATPTLWRKILMSGVAHEMTLKHIILGGEAADQSLLSALTKQFPESKITHTYASTEAGLGISVSDGLAGFPLHFLKESNSHIKIHIENNRLYLKTNSSGFGYSDDTEIRNEDGWVKTGDIVEIKDDRFFVIGRESGLINIGGSKVNPENVRQILLTHSDVVQALVYGTKNPITGMLLTVDIQIRCASNQGDTKESIRNFIRKKLSSNEQPRIINIVDEIPINSSGKLSKKNDRRS